MTRSGGINGRAAALRAEFDRVFAAPPREPPGEVRSMLAVRIEGDPYVIDIREVAEIVAKPCIVPVPTRCPDCLGIAGVRGGIVPVFSLASLMGYSANTSESPGWMALGATGEPIAWAFDEFERQVIVAKSNVFPNEKFRSPRSHLAGIMRTDDGIRPVISLGSVMKALSDRVATGWMAKEQA